MEVILSRHGEVKSFIDQSDIKFHTKSRSSFPYSFLLEVQPKKDLLCRISPAYLAMNVAIKQGVAEEVRIHMVDFAFDQI